MLPADQNNTELFEMIASRFKVMADPMRLRILHGMRLAERSVTEMSSAFETSQPNVSKHLRILQTAGLVKRRQEGNTVYYRIADQSIFDMCEAVCEGLKIKAEAEIESLATV